MLTAPPGLLVGHAQTNRGGGAGTFLSKRYSTGILFDRGGLLWPTTPVPKTPSTIIVSVLYHALQEADLYEQYANDAGGDQDLASFCEAQQQESSGLTGPSNSWPSVFSRAAKLDRASVWFQQPRREPAPSKSGSSLIGVRSTLVNDRQPQVPVAVVRFSAQSSLNLLVRRKIQ